MLYISVHRMQPWLTRWNLSQIIINCSVLEVLFGAFTVSGQRMRYVHRAILWFYFHHKVRQLNTNRWSLFFPVSLLVVLPGSTLSWVRIGSNSWQVRYFVALMYSREQEHPILEAWMEQAWEMFWIISSWVLQEGPWIARSCCTRVWDWWWETCH